MTLEIKMFRVSSLQLSNQTRFERGQLDLNADEIRESLLTSNGITDVTVQIARPKESTRILCVKDVIEPRWNEARDQFGQGVLHVLKDVAIVTCGPIVGFQEGIIDMSGPGAAYSDFSSMPLIVLQIDVVDGTKPHTHERIVREAGWWTAQHLAQQTVGLQPDLTEQIEWDPSKVKASLPRIAYIDMVLSQGLLHDTYVFGHDAKQNLPVIADPRAIIDSGVISGNCVSACDKNTTFHHQNNPVIEQLLGGHGKHWNFVGVVITNEPTRLEAKRQSAASTVELVQQLDATGVVITKEGFGNPDADLMMIIRDLEQNGVKTVAITDEYAGTDGGSNSLADTTPEANAIVSTGNANQRIVLPTMEKTIGSAPDVTRLAGGYPHSLQDDGSIEVELQAMIGATNQLGFGKLSCREV